jgi:hypothetical protein
LQTGFDGSNPSILHGLRHRGLDLLQVSRESHLPD